MKSLKEKFAQESLRITQLDLAIAILIEYNCRSIEVLSAKWNNFYPDKFLILDGAKKSSNVIVRDKAILSAINQLPRLSSELVFPSLNYYHLYRHCKKYHSHRFIKYKKRKNFKVTHAFRYDAVSQIGNDEKIRDILHHRSVKSGKFYKTK